MKSAKIDALFREAVMAIDAGDVVALERLLQQHPELACERLTAPGDWVRSQIGPALDGFFKNPYLLWFVTEDAVRTGQLSANVAAVADHHRGGETGWSRQRAAPARLDFPFCRLLDDRPRRWSSDRAARRVDRCRGFDRELVEHRL